MRLIYRSASAQDSIPAKANDWMEHAGASPASPAVQLGEPAFLPILRALSFSLMKRLSFGADVLPHGLAVLVFLLVTVIFFNPVFFDNRALSQGDITQFVWGSKEQRDYRAATGEEALWSTTMFSGMPAYLVNLDWNDGVVTTLKRVLTLFLPHPVNNIFLAFLCYYILLLSFRTRPYLAMAGALAFGISSYMIIGLAAGHNARIGAVALMPLVLAGIHLAFTGKRLLGFAVTAAALALHLRENHLQITYYLLLVVGIYGLIQLIEAVRNNSAGDFFKTVGLLAGAAVLAAGTFFGPMWAINELSRYSTRGKSDLTATSADAEGTGLPKSYAFQYSYGIGEPLTALVPNFYGGSSSDYLVNDSDSKTYQALAELGDQSMANQLAQFTSPYWGVQPLSAPYYAGSIVIFLFVLGLLVAERKYVWWLVAISLLGILLSWGSSFSAFNYFLFDYLPGYNKFRSVTFAMIMAFLAFPLLGMLGLEKLLREGITPEHKRKLLIALGATAGLCVLLLLSAGMLSFMRPEESQLPAWFLNALREDRKALLRSDLLRSISFILFIFILLFFNLPRKISPTGFFWFLMAMMTIDTGVVSARYFSETNYQRKRDLGRFEPEEADRQILADKGYYRVLNLANFYEARTSNFHKSLGGYHGVRLKRYQELYDSCIATESQELINDARQGALRFENYGVINMLNTKYLYYGQEVLPNPAANGAAWFASELVTVNSANEELERLRTLDTKNQVLVDASRFTVATVPAPDSAAVVRLVDQNPHWLKYETSASRDGVVVFSEIYYPKGWVATIDGKEVPIVRANYTLRALEVPAGNHTIEFTFAPQPYYIGNPITQASSWLLILVVAGCLVYSFRQGERKSEA